MLTLTATGNMILVAGVSVYSVCKKADAMLQQQIDAIYNNNASKDLSFEKGIAFPTCLSINHIVDNYSPLNESESLVLADGDVVKIE